MNCVHCKNPIIRYHGWSEFDPEWVHAASSMPWGSAFCEGNDPDHRSTGRIATPEPRIQEVPNGR